MGIELTGIVSPGGAKAKAEVMEDSVVFRGDIKREVYFEDITAEARGTLLVLRFGTTTVELAAGARAGQLAAKVRSPPSRLDRMGIQFGQSAAVAGPVESAFRSELGTRAVVAQGAPKDPVDMLVLAVPELGYLTNLPKLLPLLAPGGVLHLVYDPTSVPEAKLIAAAKGAGLKDAGTARFTATQTARRFTRSQGSP